MKIQDTPKTKQPLYSRALHAYRWMAHISISALYKLRSCEFFAKDDCINLIITLFLY